MSISSIANMFSNMFSQRPSFLSNLLPYGNLIDSGIGLISGISNNIYDRQLQERIFQRDDTQLSRLMSEYQRNGLNPLLGLPGASVGNTKGFEPTQLSSNFGHSFEQDIQKKSLRYTVANQRIQNQIAKEELQEKKLTNALERRLLRGQVNAQHTVKKDFYGEGNYDFPFAEEGVQYIPQTEGEKVVRFVLNSSDMPGNKAKQKNENYNFANQSLDDLVTEGKLEKSKLGNVYYIPNSKIRIDYDYTFGKYVVSDGPWLWNIKGNFDTVSEAYAKALELSN